MPCDELVSGCFAHDLAPFAVHPLDGNRAFKYLECCRENKLRWSDVKIQLEKYLKGKGCTVERIATDLEMARQKFQPWLD